MQTYLMMTRLGHENMASPTAVEELEVQVKERIAKSCPDVEWIANYAVAGPYDYVDIFRTDDSDTPAKVSTIVRTIGHADIEVWPATEWSRYKEMIRDLPKH